MKAKRVAWSVFTALGLCLAASGAERTANAQTRPIAEPRNSPGYRVDVVSALEKVFRGDAYSTQTAGAAEVAAARNEYESLQVVIEAPWRPVRVKAIGFSDLKGPGGALIPAGAFQWDRVDYIQTTTKPPYPAPRGLGWYPDPLLPAGAFTVDTHSRVPVWVTLKTPRDCPAGIYHGTITVIPDGLKPTAVAVTLTVWDFTLGDQTHLRTLTWLGEGTLREVYGTDESPAGRQRQAEICRNYEDFLLQHRLGPGGECANAVSRGADGQYDFSKVDARLERLIGGGMNAFIMGTAPNLERQKQAAYTPEFTRQFTGMLQAYGDHLRARGWLDRAYVYVYDEAPRAAWPEVQKIDLAIKAAAPGLRILQCLNQPEGVKALTGFADVFDVYVAQYQKAGVAASQKKGAEVWLAICCYPQEHPNFFIEYPLLDVRVTPWVCWKYQANGFEYWSPNAWGANGKRKSETWPRSPWTANAFGKYNGDGYLVYPGEEGKPYSSIRFEALRDGFEDYEYLWTLGDLVKKAEAAQRAGPAMEEGRSLLTLAGVVGEQSRDLPQAAALLAYRRRVAGAIVALQGPQGATAVQMR